tara:strand:+ start:429 stop:1118 length:690 start_codon:yes stop_codon:yes gene_type:complete
MYFVDWWSISHYGIFLLACKGITLVCPPIDRDGYYNRLHNIFMATVVSPIALICPLFILYHACIVMNSTPLYAYFGGVTDHVETNSYIRNALSIIIVTKYVEWLDTMWLILRRRPLQILHLIHHATIVVIFKTGFATGAWLFTGVANASIHIFMYAYYAKISVALPFAKYITTCQITHLAITFFLSMYTFFYPCCKADVNGAMSMTTAILSSVYLMLFIKLYRRKYKHE